MDKPFYERHKQLLSGLAILIPLLLLSYQLKRANDFAIVQSQYELVSLNVEMKAWLTNPEVSKLLLSTDVESMSPEQRIIFDAFVGSWFDLYEAAYIGRDRGILTDEQIKVWENGMCSVPKHWLHAFREGTNKDNYVDALVEGVEKCLR